MDKVKGGGLTTGELIAKLRQLGFDVTDSRIANDTRDGFLPEREPTTVRGRGRSGLWEPWMVARAKRLYRLRSRHDEVGRPLVSGDVLRLLLFLRDGWGWDHGIKDVCLAGFNKGVKSTLAPITRYARKLDKPNVEGALMAHEDEFDPTETERAAIGTLLHGEPLSGGSFEKVQDFVWDAGLADGLAPIASAIGPLSGALGLTTENGVPLNAQRFLGDLLFSSFSTMNSGRGLTADAMRGLIESAEPKAIEESRMSLLRFLGAIRTHIRRSALREGYGKSYSTNILTLCGHTQREIESVFRQSKIPQRMTPAQALGSLVACSVMTQAVTQSFFSMAQFAFKMFTSSMFSLLLRRQE